MRACTVRLPRSFSPVGGIVCLLVSAASDLLAQTVPDAEPLVNLLIGEDVAARQAARKQLMSLVKNHTLPPVSLARLGPALALEGQDRQWAILAVLGAAGIQAAPLASDLVAYLHRRDQDAQRAMNVLASMGPAALDALRAGLAADRPALIRRRCALLLAPLAAEPSRPDLLAELHADADAQVRGYAVWATEDPGSFPRALCVTHVQDLLDLRKPEQSGWAARILSGPGAMRDAEMDRITNLMRHLPSDQIILLCAGLAELPPDVRFGADVYEHLFGVDDPAVRAAAIASLHRMFPERARQVAQLQTIQPQDPDLPGLLHAIARSHPAQSESLGAFLRLLQDPRTPASLRPQLLTQILRCPPRDRAQALGQGLSDPDLAVRGVAVEEYARIADGGEDATGRPGWMQDPAWHRDALPGLRQAVAAPGDWPSTARCILIRALGRLGSAEIDGPPLLAMLDAPGELEVRTAAALALATLGHLPALPSIDQLRSTVDGAAKEQFEQAFRRLAGRAAPGAAADLVGLLEHLPHAQAALDKMLFHRPKPPEYAHGIAKMLRDPQLDPARPEHLRLLETAFMVLGSMQAEAAPAVPALAELLPRLPAATARKLTTALSSIGPAAAPATDALVVCISGQSDAELLSGATCALRFIGKPAAAATPALTALLDHVDERVRGTAFYALVDILAPSDLVAPLNYAAQDPAPAIRGQVAWALSRCGAAAEPALVRLAGDADANVRCQAATSLGMLPGPLAAGVAALRERLTDADFAVRKASCIALGKLGPAALAALPELEALRQDAGLGAEAAKAIAKVQAKPRPNKKKSEKAAPRTPEQQEPAAKEPADAGASGF